MSIGFRVLERTRQVDPETVARFAAIPVANISDSMSRLTGGGARVRPIREGLPGSRVSRSPSKPARATT